MHYLQFVARGMVLSLVLVSTGCSIYRAPGSQSAPVEKAPDYTKVTPPATTSPATTPPATAPQPQPPAAEPSSAVAWQPLVERAERATGRGDYEQALALLERAQRIDPDNSEIYLQLARTHEARGDLAQAQATAERGMLYCSEKSQCNALRAYMR